MGSMTIPLEASFEYAVVVTEGGVSIEGQGVGPGQLAYLGAERDELTLACRRRAACSCSGGTRPEPVVMWWNFVARTRDEVDAAHLAWATDAGRFGQVASPLPRVEVGPPPWI